MKENHGELKAFDVENSKASAGEEGPNIQI
jgi:hypothetical protein